MYNSFALATKQDREAHQRLAFLLTFLNLVEINLIFPDNVHVLSICKRSKIRIFQNKLTKSEIGSHTSISNAILLIIIYKPHIGLCNDVHLSANIFSEPFVHFEATQFPFPPKDALHKTEETKIIFNFQLTID
jgi:hypothetical protein